MTSGNYPYITKTDQIKIRVNFEHQEYDKINQKLS